MIDETPATYVIICDRCDVKVGPQDSKAMPSDWGRVHAWDEPEHGCSLAFICDGDGVDGEEPATICGDCMTSLTDWWSAPKRALHSALNGAPADVVTDQGEK